MSGFLAGIVFALLALLGGGAFLWRKRNPGRADSPTAARLARDAERKDIAARTVAGRERIKTETPAESLRRWGTKDGPGSPSSR